MTPALPLQFERHSFATGAILERPTDRRAAGKSQQPNAIIAD
jgi:hypothetical protein